MTRKEEIARLKKAALITKNIYASLSKKIKPGVRESEIAALINKIVSSLGLKSSFKTICASGPNAASPHAKITDRKISQSDVVVLDFGIMYKGFCSDMTRMFTFGKINPRMKKILKAVKIAQKSAISKISAGKKISQLAAETHDMLRKKGFGKYILHTLGHGVGRKIHQAPKLSEKNGRRLKAGTVITIEPGLYIKGLGGVRIEDMVLVTAKGRKVLTR